MAEDNPNLPVDGPDASTPIPPIDNIHSMPDLPPAEPMLPPIHTIAQPNLDTEMSEAAVRSPHFPPVPQPIPVLLPPIANPSTRQLKPPLPQTNYAPIPPTPVPAAQRTATPTRPVNGTAVAEVAPPMPSKAASHGAPARRYLNEKVTGVLLEGMKRLAADQYV